ncbi:DUF2790 domain-containing protein [Pseudomonas aeruginosa]|nr:DUF2790 domain-containing protein [Pseudomonas aeruginosa]
MKTLIAAIAMTFASCSFADQPGGGVDSAPNHDVTPYAYGLKLDVAKIISMSSEDADSCGVIPATITYVDHQGQTHTVKYQKYSNSSQCNNG